MSFETYQLGKRGLLQRIFSLTVHFDFGCSPAMAAVTTGGSQVRKGSMKILIILGTLFVPVVN